MLLSGWGLLKDAATARPLPLLLPWAYHCRPPGGWARPGQGGLPPRQHSH